MHINANLSAEERERIAYMAVDNQTASLLDAQAAIENLSTPLDYIQEARGSLPSEDWLQDELTELRHAIGAMRKGANRDVLAHLLQRIEDKRDEQARSSEYGLEQLDKAVEAIESLR